MSMKFIHLGRFTLHNPINSARKQFVLFLNPSASMYGIGYVIF